MDLNRVVFTGNLTTDPELRTLPSGSSVCSIRVACNTKRKNSDGEWVNKPNYINVSIFGASGENINRYLSKGSRVGIDGRLDWREWDGENGKRQTLEIIADTVQFLSPGTTEEAPASEAQSSTDSQTAEDDKPISAARKRGSRQKATV
jgi:single-strand DNA-binding protein